MKKLLFIVTLALPIGLFAQNFEFTIDGTVTGKAPAKVYFSLNPGAGEFDSTVVAGGKYAFTGHADKISRGYIFFQHEDKPLDLRQAKDYLTVMLDGPAVIGVTTADSVKYGTITGSKINEENAELQKLLAPSNAKMKELMAEYNAATPEQKKDEAFSESIDARYDAIQTEQAAVNKQFAASHPDSYISLLALSSLMTGDWDATEIQKIFNSISAGLRNDTDAGQGIAKQIDAKFKTSIGATAPVFTQNDPDGKPVALTDFRGKYLLIDFWASWCGPCRQENPNVVKAYEQYKDKNFEILGVSLDAEKQRDAWLAAIKKDGLVWPQVSDLQGWKNAAAELYGVRAIPANFLLDPEGKIIATNLRGEKLTEKLSEILK